MVIDKNLIRRSPSLQWLLARLFPRLRDWPLAQWSQVLTKAGAIEFDRFEQIGTLACVLLMASLIQPMTGMGAAILVAYLLQFLLLLPLLLLLLGPFFLRRIRRGLEQAAEERDEAKTGPPDGN